MQQTHVEPAGRDKDFWNRHLSWRRPFEIAVWAMVFGAGAAANVAITLIDAGRHGLAIEPWQPMVWEGSSALVSLLLVPPLLWLCERWPLHADTWARRLPVYVVASLAWSLLHVAGMVLLRIGAYAVMGDSYGFNWRIGLPYEYLKDVQTFALIVFVAYALGATAGFVLLAFSPPATVSHLTVFALAVIVGFYVINNVAHALHTPLMSQTNAISGIILVGALLQIGSADPLVSAIAFVAAAVASINIFGGFLVTYRMLGMFRTDA